MKPISSLALAVALVAVAALLVGFQGASTLLTVVEFGAAPESKPAKAPRWAHTQIRPAPKDQIQPAPKERLESSAPAPSPTAVPNPRGLAAAAQAKAQAELDAMEEPLDQNVVPRVRRTYRAPKVDKHRIY